MFRNFQMVFTKALECCTPNVELKRTTFILRRKYEPRLSKMVAQKPKKMKNKHYYYILEENTHSRKQPNVDLFLLKSVKNVGNVGDIITVGRLKAYEYFILSGAAVYATPENLEKYAHLKNDNVIPIETQNLLEKLQKTHVPVFMNDELPWTIKPWHIKLALLKIGVTCNDDCIKLPEKEISGPNMDYDKKDFLIQMTVNKEFTVPMRCRLFQMVFDDSLNLSFNPKFYLDPIQAIFPEEQSLLEQLPLPEDKKSYGIQIID